MLKIYEKSVNEIANSNDLYALLTAGIITNEQVLALAATEEETHKNVSPQVAKELDKRMLWQSFQNMYNPHIACR